MKLQRLLAPVAVASALFSAGAMAADGTINFNGNITASACSVAGARQTGSGDSVNTQATVTLPNVSIGSLDAVGIYAGHTPFSIYLTNCEATGTLNNVRTMFTTTNPAPAPDSGSMANIATASPATGIGVSILNSSFSQIDMNGINNVDTPRPLPVAGSPAAMQLDYIAAYRVLALPVTAGAVIAQASYTLTYD